MKNNFIKYSLLFALTIITIACGEDTFNSDKDIKRKADSLLKAQSTSLNMAILDSKPGIIGILNVPEMLTISKIDSAPTQDVSFKVAKAYSVLEEEMNAVGATLDGMPGMITYNNDTTNFKFECILPIKEMPKKEPKFCNIVVLEASPMLIYNYFGPYQQLYTAYNKIRDYNKANGLEQSGPMREFYLTDPTIEKNPGKWQTRIMVPVKKVK